MNIPLSVNQTELLDVLLNVAMIRPVFIWGAPKIGKSSSTSSRQRTRVSHTAGSQSTFYPEGKSIPNEVSL